MDSEFSEIMAQAERDYRLQVIRAGEQRLGMVGLTVDDLRDCKTVLDIGAGEEGYVARAAKFSGFPGHVVSIDIEPMPDVESDGLELFQFDATQEREWPPELLGKADLAVSKQGPLFKAKKEFAAEEALNAALKSLAKDKNFGLRVFPIRFGFIIEEMLETNRDYARLRLMNLKQLLKSKDNDNFNLQANRLTLDWLQEHKYNFKTGTVKQPQEMKSNNEYLTINP